MEHHTSQDQMTGKARLIVALDLKTVEHARQLVRDLDNVSFFKIGWSLVSANLRTGDLHKLLADLRAERKNIFFDLKIPDIGNTLAQTVKNLSDEPSARFLTLHADTQLDDITIAKAARGANNNLGLLMVPFLSSTDESDFVQVAPMVVTAGVTFNEWLIARARAALQAGCDGLIASGQAIRLFRNAWPRSTGVVIVSPGIRPAGSSHDDHKRFTTPAQAIEFGADYLVVGRPILNATNPREAAQKIIDEVDSALCKGGSSSSSSGSHSDYLAMTAQPHE